MQFSIYRVWLLSKKQWAENRQLYILGLLAVAGIMAGAYLINAHHPDGLSYNNQRDVLLGGAGIAGAIFTTTILSKFNDKIKGIQTLTLPASALEKLVTAIIYTALIFPLAYLLVTYPVMAFIHYIDTDIIGHTNLLYNLDLRGHFMDTIVVYLALQALVLLCSVMFKRYTIIKTTVLVIAILFGVIMLNPLIAGQILNTNALSNKKVNIRQLTYNGAGDRTQDTVVAIDVRIPTLLSSPPYGDVNMYFKNDIVRSNFYLPLQYTSSMSLSVSGTGKFIFRMLGLLLVPFLWLITWFRLKETQL